MFFTLIALIVLFLAVTFLVMARYKTPLSPGPRHATNVPKENLKFTVRWPTIVNPNWEYKVLAFAHLSAEPAADVTPERARDTLRIAQQQLGELEEEVKRRLDTKEPFYDRGSQKGSMPVLREDILTFVPSMDHVSFDPPHQPFRWKGKLVTQEFRMTVEDGLSNKLLQGKMFIYHGMIAIAQIDMAVTIDEGLSDPLYLPTKQAEAKPFQQIFVSYAHEDSCIVDHVVSMGPAMRTNYLRDRQIPPGSDWQKVLQEYIDKADAFQLFWSVKAKLSIEVEKEWRQALLVPKSDFIIPVYWTEGLLEHEPGKPPKDLEHIQFCKLPFTCEQLRGVVPVLQQAPVYKSKAGGPNALRAALAIMVLAVTGLATWQFWSPSSVTIPPIEGISAPTPVPLPSVRPTPRVSPVPTPSVTPKLTVTPTPTPTITPSPSPTAAVIVHIRAIRDITPASASLKEGDTVGAGIYLHNDSDGSAYDVMLVQDVPSFARVESVKPSLKPESVGFVRRYILRIKELPAGGRAALEFRLFIVTDKPAGKELLPMQTLTFKDANGKEYKGQ